MERGLLCSAIAPAASDNPRRHGENPIRRPAIFGKDAYGVPDNDLDSGNESMCSGRSREGSGEAKDAGISREAWSPSSCYSSAVTGVILEGRCRNGGMSEPTESR